MSSVHFSSVVAMGVLFASACFNPNYDHPTCGPHGECPSGLGCSLRGICEATCSPTGECSNGLSCGSQEICEEGGDGGAGEPPPPCAAQNVTWASGASSCTAATADALDPGATVMLTDSTPSDTGTITATCSGGKLLLSAGICEPPKVFSVGNASGCINGYCIGAIAGQCGVVDPKRPTALCVYKGYATATAYQTQAGPNGGKECSADGSGCFTNFNPSCNIVLSSVTCIH